MASRAMRMSGWITVLMLALAAPAVAGHHEGHGKGGAAGEKGTGPSAEHRAKMADAHENMATCLRSTRPISECRSEMKKAHHAAGHHAGRHAGHAAGQDCDCDCECPMHDECSKHGEDGQCSRHGKGKGNGDGAAAVTPAVTPAATPNATPTPTSAPKRGKSQK